MIIETLVVGRLQTNCYLVWDKTSHEAVIVDPGDDAELILNRVRDLNLRPILILATHGHFDHLLAVNELKWALGTPFAMHDLDCFLLSKVRQSTRYWIGLESGPPPQIDQSINEGDKILCGNQKLEVMATSGHTPGGVCLYSSKNKVLFSGDTLFRNGLGRTDFEYASSEKLRKSVQKLLRLPEETTIYPGHGLKTTIGEERSAFIGL